ncbi:hypothetical protein FTO65_06680 [Bacillus cereus]|nr:hypothetical protein [Bacillus cereus]
MLPPILKSTYAWCSFLVSLFLQNKIFIKLSPHNIFNFVYTITVTSKLQSIVVMLLLDNKAVSFC